MLARSDLDDFIEFRSETDPDDPVLVNLLKARKRRKLGTLKKIKQTTRKFKNGDRTEVEREHEIEIQDPIKALTLLAKFHRLIDTNPGKNGMGAEAESVVDEVRDAFDEADEVP